MKYDQFVERVQTRAHFASQTEAQRAIQATLEALAAFISPKERHDAASQLPKGVAPYLKRPFLGSGNLPELRREGPEAVESFLQRVSLLENVPLETAREHAHAVLRTLREALSEGEFEDIKAEIPPEVYNTFLAST